VRISRVAVILVILAAALTSVASSGAKPKTPGPNGAAGTALVRQAHRQAGVSAHKLVVQRGRRNYAGPRCPGRGWNCTRAKQVVQFASAGGTNAFVCSGSSAPGDSCIVIQTSAKSQNTATCTEQPSSYGTPASQSCVILQSSQTGKNVATVTQQLTQPGPGGANTSQAAAQDAKVYQCNTSGPNVANVSQSASQSLDAGSETAVAQGQQSGQSFLIQQGGPANGGLACPTAISPSNPPPFGTTCPTMTGSNSASATQSLAQSATASSASSGSQSQRADLGGHVNQCSNSNSAYTVSQTERQTLSAPAGILQTQIGPLTCCSFQGTNPSDTCTVSQNTNQQGNGDASQSESITSTAGTSGTCSADRSATQNGTTNTSSVSGSQLNSALLCLNGTCGTQPVPTTLSYTGSTASDYHDSLPVSAVLTNTNTGAPISGQTVSFAVSPGGETCSGKTNSAGVAACTISSLGETPGCSCSVTATFAGGGPLFTLPDGSTTPLIGPSSASNAVTVSPEETSVASTPPAAIAAGAATTVSGTLLEDGTTPIAGRSLTFTLGSGAGAPSCSGTTGANGSASCVLTVPSTASLGPTAFTVSFAGDTYYSASSASSTVQPIVFAYLDHGAFVLGDLSQSGTVTFWGSQWSQANSLSGGAAPSPFKGFANSLAPPAAGTPWCNSGGWTTDTGNSSPPPATVPAYMAVVVTAGVASSSSTVFSSPGIPKVVVVRTNAGYSGNAGGTGTGTVVATVCGS
jgi:hypothetical protein